MELKEAKITNFYNITINDEMTKASVRIPHYQRPYRWPPSYIHTLINDWKIENSGKYFAGSVVTVKSDQHQAHQIIDGQQRFTTVYLVNFVCLLLIRTTIREVIIQNKWSRIDTLFDSYKKCASYFYSEFDINEIDILQDQILAKIDTIDDQDEQKKNQIQEEIISDFCTKIHFPKSSEGDSNYDAEYKKLLAKSLSLNKLKLSYDRSSFNTHLESALSNVQIRLDSQNSQTIKLVNDSENPVVKQYEESIRQIFVSFTELGSKSNSILNAMDTVKHMETFLNEVNFCVIQTGSVYDAYTLFEVLNDRALSVDDLDLIKNQFYKKFCLSNSGEDEETIDNVIQEMEEQWGSFIFHENLKIAHKPLITYIFASFYSGKTDFLFETKGDFRTKISGYLENLHAYSIDTFQRDFNALQACTCLVESFDIWHKSKNKKALKAEYSKDSSITYKLVHFLNSLNQFGVLVGLTNVILKYIEVNISKEFEPKKVNDFFQEIIKNNSSHTPLNSLAKRIWQLTMQTSTAVEPREYAVKLIQNNHITTDRVDYQEIDFLTTKNKNNFNDWINNWRYSSGDIKACILFSILIKSSLNTSKELEFSTFSISLKESDVEKLHLDHLEPEKIEDINNEKYFHDENRSIIVNGIGNMFPLPGALNISKSNLPMKKAFPIIMSSGLGQHWLSTELKTLFENNNNNNNNNNVPTAEFFQNRKIMLKKYFYQAITNYC